jgi:hypothetical protein
MPPGEEEDRSYRREQSYRSDRDRYREHENRDRDRKRRSRCVTYQYLTSTSLLNVFF